jgi:aa3 type cytochrome c oxidase subunit IV
MADHGEVEYATATGNDYPAHEQTYENFVHFAVVGICHIINVVIALAIGTVVGHWGIMVGILIVATIIAGFDLANGSRMPSAVMVVISLLLLAFCSV